MSCKPSEDSSRNLTVTPERCTISVSEFGKIAGESVHLYTLENQSGMSVSITNYGGIVQALSLTSDQGVMTDVVLGFDSLSPYLDEHPYFGAIIGRYGNRIANGSFVLDGKEYSLVQNNGPNHLHGGLKGFDKVVWAPSHRIEEGGNAILELSYQSKHLEEGYPGNLEVQVTYTLTKDNELKIDYEAQTDQKTPVNLTNHSYFNLNGRGTIEDHQVKIDASKYTPVDQTLIPTGTLDDVENTPFDFRSMQAIGNRINADDDQINFGGGYDHNFVLDRPGLEEPSVIAIGNASGIVMEVYTQEPGVQFYTGNFLDGSITGKKGTTYLKRSGFCFETQHFPDSPNQETFPSTILIPGETYRSTTIYKYGFGPE